MKRLIKYKDYTKFNFNIIRQVGNWATQPQLIKEQDMMWKLEYIKTIYLSMIQRMKEIEMKYWNN